MKKEILKKKINGFEDKYEIWSNGIVFSLKNNKPLRPLKTKNGYLKVHFSSRGNNHYVHRLVAQAFIPNPDNLPYVNHKDENKLNNCVENLEWCSTYYNNTYGNRIKNVQMHQPTRKEVCMLDKDTNEIIETFISMREACREKNVSLRNLIRCCDNKKGTLKGYKWRYKKDIIEERKSDKYEI